MNTAQKLFIGTFAGAMSLAITGCATEKDYRPTESYSELEEQAVAETETRQLVGSRLKQTVDPNNPNPATLSPTTIITREELDRSGEIRLDQILNKHINIRSGRN